MLQSMKQELLRNLPSIDKMLKHQTVQSWLKTQARSVVTKSLRETIDQIRQNILTDNTGACGLMHVDEEFILHHAGKAIEDATAPHITGAINATGIILHTALGRAVLPESVIDSMTEELKGYVTLAIDRETGKRSERDQRTEYLLTELTGAEAGIVVNNNAAATMLALAAIAGGGEAIVSRGQLIEIGGSFRLPDVMELSRVDLREVGCTNRTHLRDYANAIRPDATPEGKKTTAIIRVHPSNFRVVGFTKQPETEELVNLAHENDLPFIDDLGAGALVSLREFGLPHEPTVQESIQAGADIVLVSTDKLIGAAQGGLILGKKEFVDKCRKHPLYRAMRVDKTCLMLIERTMMLFRDMEKLRTMHPTYRMLSTTQDQLRTRAETLAENIKSACTKSIHACVIESVGFLGSGSIPMEEIPTFAVKVHSEKVKAGDLAKRLRLDQACIFSRVEDDSICLDARTITDAQLSLIAQAIARVTK